MRAGRLAPLLAVLLTGCASSSGAHPPATAATSTPTATAIAGAPECEQLPETTAASGGDTLPRLTLACLGPGPAVALEHLTGRPTLVNLWATWCGPCREEMPLLRDAYAAHGQQIRFLGVDTQDDPAGAASFAADLHIGYPHAVDPDGRLLAVLGVRGLPVTLALDADGRIVDRVVGQLSEQRLATLIDRLS